MHRQNKWNSQTAGAPQGLPLFASALILSPLLAPIPG